MKQRITRLAPSPTGALHLGTARTFLVNYLLARRRRWQIVFRMEDLDGPRVKAGAAAEAVADLEWLGLEWDLRTPDQSGRGDAYRAALDSLLAAGEAYPCICSRTDIQRAASAPHRDDHATVYPGTCRGRWTDAQQAAREAGRSPAFRVTVGEEVIEFDDAVAGPQRFELAGACGDFVVFRNTGQPGYQLAVVVDDDAAGVTDVVRGDDLLDSAARQTLLYRLGGLGAPPRYWHLPLVVGADGLRLAKRHGDTRLAAYRAAGVTAERMLGLLGFWSGALDHRREAEMSELLERFSLETFPRERIVFSPEDDAFLTARR